MRACQSRLVLVLILIGWKSGASFAGQSQSEVIKTKENAIYFWHSIENRSKGKGFKMNTYVTLIYDCGF